MQTEVRGIEIAYETVGVGRPMVWGHGLMSSMADEAIPPVLLEHDRIAANVRLTRYDARGHGRTAFTPEPEPYAWAELAKDQLALVDELGIDRFVVGGASMGAATAIHTALMAPDRVEALVLVIPPTAWQTRRGQVDMYHKMTGIIDARGVELLINAGAAVAPPDPFLDHPEFKERSAARLREADPVRLSGILRGASTAEMPSEEAVATIDKPTLILAWTGDAGHPVSTAERLAELMPQAQLSLASTWDDYRTWTDRTIQFLAR